MSDNNDEYMMYAEFHEWFIRQPKCPTKPINPFDAWKASAASKQREIDALKQQVLELSAMVEKMREVPLQMRCEAAGNSRYGKCEPTREIVLRDVANSLDRILSLSQSEALQEHEAVVLEDLTTGMNADDKMTAGFIRERAAERRNRK